MFPWIPLDIKAHYNTTVCSALLSGLTLQSLSHITKDLQI